MATSFRSPNELSPQREAAYFYALFLRGHRVEALRQDIDVPREVFERWMRANDFETDFRDSLRRLYDYRKRVLAIFDSLIATQRTMSRLQ